MIKYHGGYVSIVRKNVSWILAVSEAVATGTGIEDVSGVKKRLQITKHCSHGY